MNPIRPLTIKRITCNTKGCRNIYDVLIKTKQIPSSHAKWRRDLTINPNFKFIYDIPFSCTKDRKLQWLRYRINHRILGTNYVLVKMGIKNSEICSFCNTEQEALVHLFWNCTHVVTFINVVSTWLNTILHDVNITLYKENFMWGSKRLSCSLNTIILLSIQYIYSCKMNISLPNINVFKNIVKEHMNIEKYQSKTSCTLVQFERKRRQFAAALEEEG